MAFPVKINSNNLSCDSYPLLVDFSDRLEAQQEDEENDWARKFLIPSEYDAELYTLRSHEAVIDITQRLGIHTGIVVGRLQYGKIVENNSKLYVLKVSFDLENIET